jgi:hypothetical protein
MSRTPSHPRLYLAIGLLWFTIAFVLAASGRLLLLRPPVPQLVLAGLTIGLIAAGALAPGFRVWLAGLNIRQIVAIHVTRFIGIYFLVLYGRGELPWAFAVPGGWGDIVVATGALGLVLLVPDLASRRGLVMAWNVVGMVDILGVVATAFRLALADPASMSALLRLPLSLLPTFLVPVIIASHVLLFARLRPESVSSAPDRR